MFNWLRPRLELIIDGEYEILLQAAFSPTSTPVFGTSHPDFERVWPHAVTKLGMYARPQPLLNISQCRHAVASTYIQLTTKLSSSCSRM